ncbi:MAG: nucleotidyltransferase family protein [Chloroflexi bacterium]|nr:MAG: nucleotidyltransferase family protein [Chloroflexota bacterium]
MSKGAVSAILLAAGESTRMGSPKPLLAWQGATLIEYQIAQLREAGVSDVIAVLGHRSADFLPLVSAAGARGVFNERYREGRASSLRAGAAAVEGAQTVVVLSVDQPRPASVTRRLLGAHASGITVPSHTGRRGHPVVLDAALLPELREADEATQGLRAVLARHAAEVHEVPFDSAAVLLDLITPQDYEQAIDRDHP